MTNPLELYSNLCDGGIKGLTVVHKASMTHQLHLHFWVGVGGGGEGGRGNVVLILLIHYKIYHSSRMFGFDNVSV